MIERQIQNFLEEEGYLRIPSNLPEFTIYFHMENHYVNVFHIIDYQKGIYISEDQYIDIKEKIKEFFASKGIESIHILSLIISEDIEKARRLCGEDSLCWIIDSANRRLIIYENQMDDFYGMRSKLEYWIAQTQEDLIQKENYSGSSVVKKEKNLAYTTITLVIINVILFLICTFTGDLLYNKGALSVQNIIDSNEYYRIFSSMFLHWDINHLVSNMLVLYYLGEVVEKYFGHVQYGIIYMISGVFANVLSMGYEIYAENYSHSAGASGAVFGIIGALLLLVLVHKGHFGQITFGRLVFMIFYSLYSGFVGSNINNAAHIGGFLSGVGTAFILYLLNVYRQKNKERLPAHDK